MTIRELAFALVLVGAACGKSATENPPAADKPAVPNPAPPAEAKTPTATTPPPAVRDQEACALLTAAEVATVFGRTVVVTGSGHSCRYELDPAAKQKEMDALAKGGANAAFQMGKGGGFKIPSAISDQLVVDLGIERDTQTEDEVKAIHAKVSTAVNGTVKPDEHGLSGTLAAGKDIAGIGDWAFSTNIAAVNMGMGMSTRGRLLEARQGPWHLSVSVTIAPDPGETKLDTELADIARDVVAKLK